MSLGIDADAGAVVGCADEFDAGGFVEINQCVGCSLGGLVSRARVFTANNGSCSNTG